MSCTRLIAAALAVATLAFSGCGGSKPSSSSSGSAQTSSATNSTSSHPLTRTALIASATQICTHARGLMGTMKASSKQALASDLTQAATYVQTAAGELDRLKAEPALASDLEHITGALHSYSVEATEASERLTAKDQEGAREAFLAYRRANAAVVATAKRDGLSVCTTFL